MTEEEHYCLRCGKRITEEEFQEYDGYCPECWEDEEDEMDEDFLF